MANSITSNGSVVVNVETLQLVNNMSFSQNITGSNVVGTVQSIDTGSWKALDTSSIGTTTRWFIASNEDLSGSISIALDVAGTKTFAIMAPGDSLLVPWSGITTMPLFAKASSSVPNTFAVFQYIVTQA